MNDNVVDNRIDLIRRHVEFPCLCLLYWSCAELFDSAISERLDLDLSLCLTLDGWIWR